MREENQVPDGRAKGFDPVLSTIARRRLSARAEKGPQEPRGPLGGEVPPAGARRVPRQHTRVACQGRAARQCQHGDGERCPRRPRSRPSQRASGEPDGRGCRPGAQRQPLHPGRTNRRAPHQRNSDKGDWKLKTKSQD